MMEDDLESQKLNKLIFQVTLDNTTPKAVANSDCTKVAIEFTPQISFYQSHPNASISLKRNTDLPVQICLKPLINGTAEHLQSTIIKVIEQKLQKIRNQQRQQESMKLEEKNRRQLEQANFNKVRHEKNKKQQQQQLQYESNKSQPLPTVRKQLGESGSAHVKQQSPVMKQETSNRNNNNNVNYQSKDHFNKFSLANAQKTDYLNMIDRKPQNHNTNIGQKQVSNNIFGLKNDNNANRSQYDSIISNNNRPLFYGNSTTNNQSNTFRSNTNTLSNNSYNSSVNSQVNNNYNSGNIFTTNNNQNNNGLSSTQKQLIDQFKSKEAPTGSILFNSHPNDDSKKSLGPSKAYKTAYHKKDRVT